MGFLKKKSAQYKAAIRVEKYRARAVELREHDPDTYAQMVASADGSEAEGAAQSDPDAYVALLMAASDDAEAGGDEPVAVQRDIDYWPSLDLDAAWAELVEGFMSNPAQQAGETIYYRKELVRRMVASILIGHAASTHPELWDAWVRLSNVGDDSGAFLREDPEIDERLDQFLLEIHLSQIVEAFVQALTAEEGPDPAAGRRALLEPDARPR